MARKFGCNSTGEDVLKGIDVSGKTAIVTGDHPVVTYLLMCACMQQVHEATPLHRLMATEAITTDVSPRQVAMPDWAGKPSGCWRQLARMWCSRHGRRSGGSRWPRSWPPAG